MRNHIFPEQEFRENPIQVSFDSLIQDVARFTNRLGRLLEVQTSEIEHNWSLAIVSVEI